MPETTVRVTEAEFLRGLSDEEAEREHGFFILEECSSAGRQTFWRRRFIRRRPVNA